MPRRGDLFNSPFGREVGRGLQVAIVNLSEAVTEALFGKKPGKTRPSYEQDVWEAKRNFERAKRKKDSDPYSVLGVSRDADDEAIKGAYHYLSKKYHPDSGKNPNAEKMKRINKAFAEIKKERGL